MSLYRIILNILTMNKKFISVKQPIRIREAFDLESLVLIVGHLLGIFQLLFLSRSSLLKENHSVI